MASINPQAFEAVLRRSVLCRTNNFDLIEENGWKALATDLAEDFPYLTLSELNAIIKLGYKGKLDEYKNLPLNYTRIYQWVEKEAPKQPSAWRAKFPEVFGWADMTGLAEPLATKLSEAALRTKLADVNQGIALTELRELLKHNTQATPRWVNEPTHGELLPLFEAFGAKCPAWFIRHRHLLY